MHSVSKIIPWALLLLVTMWYSCKQCDISEILLEIHIKHTLHYSLLPSSRQFFFFFLRERQKAWNHYFMEKNHPQTCPNIEWVLPGDSSPATDKERDLFNAGATDLCLLEPEMVLWSSLARSVHCLLPPIWPGHPGAWATGKEATLTPLLPQPLATPGKGSEVSTPHPHSPMDLWHLQ